MGSLPIDLELTVQTYLCALMLAFPGAVRPTGNIWSADGVNYRNSTYYLSEIHEAIEFLREKNAFLDIKVSVEKVK